MSRVWDKAVQGAKIGLAVGLGLAAVATAAALFTFGGAALAMGAEAFIFATGAYGAAGAVMGALYGAVTKEPKVHSMAAQENAPVRTRNAPAYETVVSEKMEQGVPSVAYQKMVIESRKPTEAQR